jgi:spermidine/putrescine transport system permease protein
LSEPALRGSSAGGSPTSRAPRERHWDAPLSWLVMGRTPLASHLLLSPAALWVLVLLVSPVALLILLSFAKIGAYGRILWRFSLANFAQILRPAYLWTIGRTLVYAGATASICLLLGFPAAYYLSFAADSKRKNLLLFAIMLPFWTSALVAIYCWLIVLGREGLLNTLLLRIGFLSSPFSFLNTPFSVILGLVYFYLPYMVLPLYAALEKIPQTLIEASHDLGAGDLKTFLRVILPLSWPGVASGAILIFVPCLGDFLTAEFLGGPKTYLLGNLIDNQFLAAQNWPLGAALTVLLMGLLMSGLYFYGRVEVEETSRV